MSLVVCRARVQECGSGPARWREGSDGKHTSGIQAPLRNVIRGRQPRSGNSTEGAALKLPHGKAPGYYSAPFQGGRRSAEQGKPAEMVCKVDPKAAWQGDATATLVGYPAHIKVAPLKLSKNAKELVFKLDIGKEAPVGKHASLFVQLLVPENGDLIQHNLAYGGTLRIDAPPPPKKDAPPAPVAKPAAPAAQPPPAAAAPPKRLTRLEQLRLEQSEKAKAEKK